MNVTMLTKARRGATRGAMRRRTAAILAAGMLSACIQITAPEKPIEINLNVNIRQEVVVSLRDDVKNLEQQYPGVF